MDSTAHEDNTAWLALLRAPGVGCQTINAHLAAGLAPRDLIEHPGQARDPALQRYLREPDWHGVEQDLRWLEGAGNRLLRIDEAAYPTRLRDLANPPSVLFTHGDPSLLELPQLAIVGSRTPSTGGRRTAQAFAAHLAEAGLVISSGLAAGIDAEVDRGA